MQKRSGEFSSSDNVLQNEITKTSSIFIDDGEFINDYKVWLPFTSCNKRISCNYRGTLSINSLMQSVAIIVSSQFINQWRFTVVLFRVDKYNYFIALIEFIKAKIKDFMSLFDILFVIIIYFKK